MKMYQTKMIDCSDPYYSFVKDKAQTHYYKVFEAEPNPEPNCFICLNDKTTGDLLACIGVTYAASGKLFSEYYLETHIDSIYPINREKVIEISSFCSFYSKLGLGTYIIKNIISMFSARGYEYILLTATDQVKKLIYSLVEEVEILAVADPRKVQNHNINWGTYYTNNPHVIMFKLPSISSKDLKDEAKIA